MRARLFIAAVAAVVAAAAAPPAGPSSAAPVDAPAITAPPGGWQVIDGDAVLPAQVAAQSDVSTAAVNGAGFNTLGSVVGSRSSYTIRLISSGNIETFRPTIQAAANDLAGTTGGSYPVAAGTTTSTDPAVGEILIVVSSSSPCNGTANWIGCGGPEDTAMGPAGWVSMSGAIWLHPTLLNYSATTRQSTVAHEIGHVLGLDHFDGTFEGSQQIMHSSVIPSATYRSGDANGLRYLYANRQTVPGAPTIGTATAGNASATVRWTAPATTGGPPITSYRVRPYVSGTGYLPEITFNSVATAQTITGLTNGTTYRFNVRAINSIGAGATSSLSAAVTPKGAPTVPLNVRGDASVPGEISAYWDAPQSNGGSPLIDFRVTRIINGTAQAPVSVEAPIVVDEGASITWTDVIPGASYQFRVAAANAIGTGPSSATTTAVVPPGPPSAPGKPVATPKNASASLTWSAPTADGGSPVTGYVVTPYVGTTALASRAFPSTATTQTVTGLTNGTTYTFKVAAVNGVGTSGTSPASNAVTPATVPGQPTIKTAVPGNGTVTLSWTPPTSNGGSPITKYVVIVSIDGVSQGWHNFNSTASTQVVSGLSNGTTYTFQVMAQNAIGLGVPSPASTAVTPSVAPHEPFASWSALVDRQFLDITAKLPTSSQRSSWVNQLSNGTKSKGELVDALRRGPENLANVDPVVRVYRAFLGRAPDAGGLKFWINRKRSIAPAKTWTVTQIATEFTNSNEFKTKYGSLTNRQFVTQIYTDVLGRDADTSGVNYWTGKLDRKEKTKAQVVVGFSESNEYKTKQAQNTDVAVAFIYLLGRAPTAAEALDWTSRQKAGATHASLLTELLNTAAYATHIGG
jgi:hypothetical protein